jgi:hypothetical protein
MWENHTHPTDSKAASRHSIGTFGFTLFTGTSTMNTSGLSFMNPTVNNSFHNQHMLSREKKKKRGCGLRYAQPL